MQEMIVQIMEKFGYIGIALLIAIENIFPPIPSEVILTFGGFMTTFSQMKIWGVIIAATIGAVIGAIALYMVGRFFSAERLERWVDSKLGRILHLKKGDIQKSCEWFEKKGKISVFFGRCIPIVRSLISIPAGMAKMKMSLFLLMTISGSLIWNIILVYLGAMAGESWGIIVGYMDTYSIIAVVVLGTVALILGLIFVKKRFIKKEEQQD